MTHPTTIPSTQPHTSCDPSSSDPCSTTSSPSSDPGPAGPADPTSSSPTGARRARRTPRNARRTNFGTTRLLPSGRWQARYTDTDANRRPAPRTFATRREAEDWITTRRAEHLRGEWRSPELGAVRLVDYLAEYLTSRVELAPRTLYGYRFMADRWLLVELTHPTGRLVRLASTPLRDLSPILVRDWHAAALLEAQRRAVEHLTASDRRRSTRALHAARIWARESGWPVKASGRLSPALVDAWRASGAPAAATYALPPSEPPRDAGKVQVARAYSLLRAVLGTAHRDGLIPANPCTLRGAGSVRSAERPHATPEEVDRLSQRMPAHLAAAVPVAAWSGLRAGELFALTRAHVDLTRGTVRVERAVVEIPGQPIRFGPPKTVASQRTVHLPAPIVDLLATHLAQHAAPGPDALVFSTPQGAPVPAATRTRHFRTACASEGLHRLRWHDLRHTGATYAAQAGASLRELQARLGHSTVAAAMTYQHATADRDRDLAQRMAAAIPVPATVSRLSVVQ